MKGLCTLHLKSRSGENRHSMLEKYSNIVQTRWSIMQWKLNQLFHTLLLTWQMQLGLLLSYKNALSRIPCFSFGVDAFYSIMVKLTWERNISDKHWIWTLTISCMPSSGKAITQWRKWKKKLVKNSRHKTSTKQLNFTLNVWNLIHWTPSIIKPYYSIELVHSTAKAKTIRR